MKTMLKATILGLALSATPALADDDVTLYQTSEPFEDVAFNISESIINRGYVVDYHGMIGEMLQRTAADVGARLDRLMAPKLVGIRHQVHDEADPAWLSRPDVRRGLAAVFARDLAFDLLVRTRELPAAIAAAQALPQGRFILDHAAKPPIAAGFDDTWAERLAALADCPNVWCKISGLVTEADWHDCDVDRLRPFVDHAVRMFGPRRLIFGSDWPVCLLAAEYGAVKAAAEVLLPRDAFGANAVAAYRLFRAQPA